MNLLSVVSNFSGPCPGEWGSGTLLGQKEHQAGGNSCKSHFCRAPRQYRCSWSTTEILFPH